MKPVIDDPIEAAFMALCDEFGIAYERPERNGGRIDFYLPSHNLYVEVKAYSCERLHAQIESAGNAPAIVLIGLGAVRALDGLMRLQGFLKEGK